MEDLRTRLASGAAWVGQTKFLSIDGHGGSGKSTLAMYLGEKLEAEIIHIDDFSGWDSPPNWWKKIIQNVFMPISEGAASITYQPVSWSADHHPALVENQPVTPFMILEGVSSSRPEFLDFIAFSIFVDTPKAECLRRGIERDRVSGKSEDELRALWHGWMAEEDRYFSEANPRAHADLVIDGAKPFDAQIRV